MPRTPRSNGSVEAPTAPHPPLAAYYQRPDDRRRFVNRIFDRTAAHYDRMDRLMTFGSGSSYRRDALVRAGLAPGMTVLDVAVGTGLVAEAARAVMGDRGRVLGLDASAGMLIQARRRLGLPLMQGLAERLPLRGDTVDFLTMGYALRHVEDLHLTLEEYRRVLKPGGALLILEISRPRSGLLRLGLKLYLGTVVPALARLAGGDESRTLFRYFWDTIENCIPPATILDAIANAGLAEPRRLVVAGVFSEYRAVKRQNDKPI